MKCGGDYHMIVKQQSKRYWILKCIQHKLVAMFLNPILSKNENHDFVFKIHSSLWLVGVRAVAGCKLVLSCSSVPHRSNLDIGILFHQHTAWKYYAWSDGCEFNDDMVLCGASGNNQDGSFSCFKSVAEKAVVLRFVESFIWWMDTGERCVLWDKPLSISLSSKLWKRNHRQPYQRLLWVKQATRVILKG